MTLSMKRALDLINEKKEDITLNDLGFILTVLRDNVSDDRVYEVLKGLVNNIPVR